ncbi:MAG: HAD family hydrolase, partial [Candidatus Lokiarchaeota archaeon]|nr:HAD family hydrolase [Candidatus Lokiarchaeota archaeon]
MKIYEIPNYKRLEIKNILLDINGTIQFNGKISVELKQKIMELKQKFKIILISADTRGNLKEIASELDLNYEKLTEN